MYCWCMRSFTIFVAVNPLLPLVGVDVNVNTILTHLGSFTLTFALSRCECFGLLVMTLCHCGIRTREISLVNHICITVIQVRVPTNIQVTEKITCRIRFHEKSYECEFGVNWRILLLNSLVTRLSDTESQRSSTSGFKISSRVQKKENPNAK